MEADLLTSLILKDLEEDEITEEFYHTSDNKKDQEEVTENESYAAATNGEMQTSFQQLQLASDGATTVGTVSLTVYNIKCYCYVFLTVQVQTMFLC